MVGVNSSHVQQVAQGREEKQFAVGQVAKMEVGSRSMAIPSIS